MILFSVSRARLGKIFSNISSGVDVARFRQKQYIAPGTTAVTSQSYRHGEITLKTLRVSWMSSRLCCNKRRQTNPRVNIDWIQGRWRLHPLTKLGMSGGYYQITTHFSFYKLTRTGNVTAPCATLQPVCTVTVSATNSNWGQWLWYK